MQMSRTDKGAEVPVTGTSGKRTIMIVDDHPLVCKGLEELIKGALDLEVFAVAGNAIQATDTLRQGLPDLMLLDLSLPEASGLDLLKNVRINYPDLPVLVLSMHEENVYGERVLRAGARGYIMKQEPGEKVIEAIRCVLNGDIFASPNLLTNLLQKFTVNGDVKRGTGRPDTLADRELQVYSLIGEGLSSREIAKRLHLSPKTIQTYREHLKAKLGLKNASELTRSAVLWSLEEQIPLETSRAAKSD